ncbi:hypothetical protein LCGC14_0446860 [marine sediment metagenome]|uniref:Uncharacterized protein n=1 Tax=marine sediment metagenome TaxID=412755 RepID=A0A0F9SIX3_9ZZZZ
MGTKNNPTPNDCYDKAEPDEPMFILLARDPHAPALVELWANLRQLHGRPEDDMDGGKIDEARACATAMVD